MLSFLSVCLVRRSVRLLCFSSFFQQQEYFSDCGAPPSSSTSATSPSPSAPWSSQPPSSPSLEGTEVFDRAASFSLFQYMLVRFELAAAVSSYRNNGDLLLLCESVPGKVCGKELADTTGLQNEEENVSTFLQGGFGGITPRRCCLVFDTARTRTRRNLLALSFTSSFAPNVLSFFFSAAACRRRRFSSII